MATVRHCLQRRLEFVVVQYLKFIVHEVFTGRLQQVWKHIFNISRGMNLWHQAAITGLLLKRVLERIIADMCS